MLVGRDRWAAGDITFADSAHHAHISSLVLAEAYCHGCDQQVQVTMCCEHLHARMGAARAAATDALARGKHWYLKQKHL